MSRQIKGEHVKRKANLSEAQVCGKYKKGDLVNINIKTTKKTGSHVYAQFAGLIKECRHGVYYVVNPKSGDWCFATEDEIVKYPSYVKKSWMKK